MLTFKESLKKLENSKEFKEFMKKNENVFLCNGFVILENGVGDWQIDFYDDLNDKLMSFTLKGKIMKRESEAFKNEKIKISELDAEKVKIELKNALDNIKELMDKKYSNESVTKTIVILQNYKKKNIWNITHITTSFKTLNVKLNAENGKIISEDLKSVIM